MAYGSEGMSMENCLVSPFFRPMICSSNVGGNRLLSSPYCISSVVIEAMSSPLSSVAVILRSTYLSSFTLVLAFAGTISM